MKTLVIDTKRIREEHGTAAHYARAHGAEPRELSLIASLINKMPGLIDRMIEDGYLSIEEINGGKGEEISQKAKSA